MHIGGDDWYGCSNANRLATHTFRILPHKGVFKFDGLHSVSPTHNKCFAKQPFNPNVLCTISSWSPSASSRSSFYRKISRQASDIWSRSAHISLFLSVLVTDAHHFLQILIVVWQVGNGLLLPALFRTRVQVTPPQLYPVPNQVDVR